MKSDRSKKIDNLLREQPLVWKAGEQTASCQQTGSGSLDTGFDALNGLLKTGGWPRGNLVEIQVEEWGQGELQLLLPAMAALSQQQQQLAAHNRFQNSFCLNQQD